MSSYPRIKRKGLDIFANADGYEVVSWTSVDYILTKRELAHLDDFIYERPTFNEGIGAADFEEFLKIYD